MTLLVRRSLKRGTLLVWATMVLVLSLATACADATAPKYPQADDDSSRKDTVRTSVLMLPPASPRV